MECHRPKAEEPPSQLPTATDMRAAFAADPQRFVPLQRDARRPADRLFQDAP